MLPNLPLRESGFLGGVAWFMAVWAGGFALNTALVADQLTSPQWRSLMTVPGGKWFWVAVFGLAAAALGIGLIANRYRLRAIGLGLIGLGCGSVMVFYILAPWFNLGPTTLGHWPWVLGVGIGVFGFVVNWWPIPWF